jgi:hypothetical protein
MRHLQSYGGRDGGRHRGSALLDVYCCSGVILILSSLTAMSESDFFDFINSLSWFPFPLKPLNDTSLCILVLSYAWQYMEVEVVLRSSDQTTVQTDGENYIGKVWI